MWMCGIDVLHRRFAFPDSVRIPNETAKQSVRIGPGYVHPLAPMGVVLERKDSLDGLGPARAGLQKRLECPAQTGPASGRAAHRAAPGHDQSGRGSQRFRGSCTGISRKSRSRTSIASRVFNMPLAPCAAFIPFYHGTTCLDLQTFAAGTKVLFERARRTCRDKNRRERKPWRRRDRTGRFSTGRPCLAAHAARLLGSRAAIW